MKNKSTWLPLLCSQSKQATKSIGKIKTGKTKHKNTGAWGQRWTNEHKPVWKSGAGEVGINVQGEELGPLATGETHEADEIC